MPTNLSYIDRNKSTLNWISNIIWQIVTKSCSCLATCSIVVFKHILETNGLLNQ